jgi:hypothetical protein
MDARDEAGANGEASEGVAAVTREPLGKAVAETRTGARGGGASQDPLPLSKFLGAMEGRGASEHTLKAYRHDLLHVAAREWRPLVLANGELSCSN